MSVDRLAEILRAVRGIPVPTPEDPYAKGDLVWWTDIHGQPRSASVERVNGDRVDIRIGGLGTVVEVDPRELSPR